MIPLIIETFPQYKKEINGTYFPLDDSNNNFAVIPVKQAERQQQS